MFDFSAYKETLRKLPSTTLCKIHSDLTSLLRGDYVELGAGNTSWFEDDKLKMAVGDNVFEIETSLFIFLLVERHLSSNAKEELLAFKTFISSL